MMQPSRTKLKTGQRPVQQQILSFKSGETIFSEGSTGRELFILHEGCAGVFKNGPDGPVALAQIEQGGIFGEMSLLDTLPRSATVKALDNVKVLVIGYAQFQAVMLAIPAWLQSIIKIVVSRLRDANKRVDHTSLRDKERGVIALLLLLLPVYRQEVESNQVLSYDLLLREAVFVCRLRKKDVVHVIDTIVKRGIVQVAVLQEKKYIKIADRELLHLFNEYLTLKSQKKSFKDGAIPRETIAILSNIAYVSQKSGFEAEDGIHLKKSDLHDELSAPDAEHLEMHLLDLRRRNLLVLFPAADGDSIIVFRKEVLGRIKKIQEWLPRFSEELA